jgi:hypothetical protein
MANAKYELSFLDNTATDKAAKSTINTPQLSAVTVLTIGASVAAYRAAVAGISLATISAERFEQFANSISSARPGSTAAQNENRWLVRATSTAGNHYRYYIPCAKLTLLASGTEFLDIDTALSEGNVFRLAFELLAVGKDGNPLTVDSVQFVGHR